MINRQKFDIKTRKKVLLNSDELIYQAYNYFSNNVLKPIFSTKEIPEHYSIQKIKTLICETDYFMRQHNKLGFLNDVYIENGWYSSYRLDELIENNFEGIQLYSLYFNDEIQEELLDVNAYYGRCSDESLRNSIFNGTQVIDRVDVEKIFSQYYRINNGIYNIARYRYMEAIWIGDHVIFCQAEDKNKYLKYLNNKDNVISKYNHFKQYDTLPNPLYREWLHDSIFEDDKGEFNEI